MQDVTTGWTIEIPSERENREINGYDTVILKMPQEFYVVIGDEKPALAVKQFSKFLRNLSEEMALGVREAFHHGIYTVTTDPDVVAALGTMHKGCPECEAGTANAVALMLEEPGLEIVVGQLWWTAPTWRTR